eukprot:m.182980 g.182980  ORF g.182980 m.182980 type:complete len:185 (+) comp15671_c0_seq1:87-641(+)
MGLILSKVICGVFGSIYPGYMSYKTVKNKDVLEYKRWMKYWIVYSFFTVAELIFDWFAAVVPLYYELKIIFVLYLMLPQFTGATTVYDSFLLPLLNEHEDTIDGGIVEARTVATRKLSGVADEAKRRSSTRLYETWFAMNQMLESQLKDDSQDHAPVRTRSRPRSGLSEGYTADEIANGKGKYA